MTFSLSRSVLSPPSVISSGHVRTSKINASPRVVPISSNVNCPFEPKLIPSQSNDITTCSVCAYFKIASVTNADSRIVPITRVFCKTFIFHVSPTK